MRMTIRFVIPFFIALCFVATALLFHTSTVMVWLLPVFGRNLPLSDTHNTAENVTWIDDYYTIEYIDPKTIAIGEPRYHQKNYNYLILGEKRAVLFDSGSGVRDISPVVKSLTSLPITVTASHLHYDHIGNINRFANVALIDIPAHRALADHNSVFAPSDAMHLGGFENISVPIVTVKEWWNPSATVDLGGRSLTVLHTPGHTEGSVMLYDEDRRLLFTGDYIYPAELIAFFPDSHMGDYLKTADQLLSIIDPNTVLLTAHAGGELPLQAPKLSYGDLVDLKTTLEKIKNNSVKSLSFFPTSYPINNKMELLGNFSWNMEWGRDD